MLWAQLRTPHISPCPGPGLQGRCRQEGALLGGKNGVCKMKGIPDAVSWEVGRRPSGNCPCSARRTLGHPPPSLQAEDRVTGRASCPPRGVVGEPEQARGGQGMPSSHPPLCAGVPPPITGPQPRVPRSGLDVAPVGRWGSREDGGSPGCWARTRDVGPQAGPRPRSLHRSALSPEPSTSSSTSRELSRRVQCSFHQLDRPLLPDGAPPPLSLEFLGSRFLWLPAHPTGPPELTRSVVL